MTINVRNIKMTKNVFLNPPLIISLFASHTFNSNNSQKSELDNTEPSHQLLIFKIQNIFFAWTVTNLSCWSFNCHRKMQELIRMYWTNWALAGGRNTTLHFSQHSLNNQPRVRLGWAQQCSRGSWKCSDITNNRSGAFLDCQVKTLWYQQRTE